MVLGRVILEGRSTTALFDTGAEGSLATESMLKEVAPEKKLDTSNIPKVKVADGATLTIHGSVKLKVTAGLRSVIDHFVVTSDSLTVPLLLGCSTLAKLNTTIVLSEAGSKVQTNDQSAGNRVPSRVRFSDEVKYLTSVAPIKSSPPEENSLPPWKVIPREWVYDHSAVLGRPIVEIPWSGNARPDFNYKQAANRGAASVRRLNESQRQAFEKALGVYVNKGFCGIVKNNLEGNCVRSPTATECQRTWDLLSK
ncbi:hypothetical protein FOZ62_006837, partial [Perkinsus olseni]